jgi:menaquinone-dependent protoporphyrinogen oxidase
LKDLIKAREHKIFPGALDPDKLALSHKVVRRMPAARDLMPEGDFRNWKEIEEWADGIARQLKTLSQ